MSYTLKDLAKNLGCPSTSEAPQKDTSFAEQLRGWLEGVPTHRAVPGDEDGECCPDFSCCAPSLLSTPEERTVFVLGNYDTRREMVSMFITRAVKHLRPDEEVLVYMGTGGGAVPGDTGKEN